MNTSLNDKQPLVETPKKGRVFIRTFGCQMNQYDSLKLAKILEPKYNTVDRPEDADLVVINTCSVRGKPEQKLYSLLGEVQEIKKINPNLMIGVGGCVAQQEGENIIKRSRDVDFVFGTHNLSLVPSLVKLRKEGAGPQVAVNYRDEWEELPLGFTEENRTSAFVSISRGCNKNCSYCIVPTTRGPEVSRSPDEILREIKLLTHRGAREIMLLGQTVNSYGLDFNPRRSFVWLLEQVADIKEVKRIRFISPHPQEIRDDFIDLVCSNPKIAHHIHMPLQSGNDRILKLMNRNYRRERYLSIIEAIKTRVPDMAVTTDIIVGFPGETEDEFNDTLDIVKRVQFDGSFPYIFSPRPGTKAAEMEDLVTQNEKLARIYKLIELQDQITKERLAYWVNREIEILIDGTSALDARYLKGRTPQNIVVNLTDIAPTLSTGDIVKVKITEAAKFTLKGQLLGMS